MINPKPKPHITLIMMMGLLCLALLSNCTPDAITPTTLTSSPLISPLPEAENNGKTPSNANFPAEWLATPEPGKAIVKGYIKMSDQPSALLGELFLGKAMPTSDTEIELLELDQENAPRAIIERDTMAFIFLNVEPGRYGIIAWEPMCSLVLNDPNTGQTLYIDVKADEVVEVGTLNFP